MSYMLKIVQNDDFYKTEAAVDGLLKYCNKNDAYTVGINCPGNAKGAAEHFKYINKTYEKHPSKYVRHMVLSPDDSKMSPEKLRQIAYEIGRYYEKDNQLFIAVHTDSNHIHAHMVMNTISYRTGLIYSYSEAGLNGLLSYADSLGYGIRMGSEAK